MPTVRSNTRFLRRWTAATLIGLAAPIAVVPVAQAALVVPGKSIGKVSLLESKAGVRRALGKPTRVTQEYGDCGKTARCAEQWYYRKLKLTVGLCTCRVDVSETDPPRPEAVTQIISQNKADKTAAGIHIGSTLKQVKAAYPALVCATNDPNGYCYLPGPGQLDWTIFQSDRSFSQPVFAPSAHITAFNMGYGDRP